MEIAQGQWDTLWKNVHLATMTGNNGYGVITHGALAIKGQRIAWLGPQQECPKPIERYAKNIIDGQGKWLTPGLIDCHTHLVYAGNRANEFEQRLQGKSYAEIAQAGGGITATVEATRLASDEELFNASKSRLLALMREGVTTCEIKSGYGLSLAQEAKMLQVARQLAKQYPVSIYNTFLGAHTCPQEYDGRTDDYINLVCENMLPYMVENQLADAVDVFCETIAFSCDQVERVFKVAKAMHLPIKCHAEQLSNQQASILAAQYGALSVDHLEYLCAKGVQALAKSSTVAVLLPGAYYFLGEKKCPPVNLLREYQVPIAIATDCNPGSSPTTSLLLMLNMACTLFGLTPTEALHGVTNHAAKALGIADEVGTLSIGKVADLILWDIESPTDLSYQFGFNPCVQVIKLGEKVSI